MVSRSPPKVGKAHLPNHRDTGIMLCYIRPYDVWLSQRCDLMLKKLPFVGRIYWKIFAIVFILLGIGWAVTIWIYESITRTDMVGSVISALLLTYLVHLWLLPPEETPDDPASDSDDAGQQAPPS